MSYVITCGDEGVQINDGIRLAVAGAGVELYGFDQIVPILKDLLGEELRIAASEENAWVKEKLDLDTWEQANASAQQQTELIADQNGLLYSGILPFADPQELGHGIKGHMVRPHGIHIATKITFTLDGGEQTYHLGQYLISAEWVSKLPLVEVEQILALQVGHYQKLAKGQPLTFDYQMGGKLGEELALENKAVLESLGYALPE